MRLWIPLRGFVTRQGSHVPRERHPADGAIELVGHHEKLAVARHLISVKHKCLKNTNPRSTPTSRRENALKQPTPSVKRTVRLYVKMP